jgi:competence protein ComGC
MSFPHARTLEEPMRIVCRASRLAFTLVELLVVVTIIMILVSMLIPSIEGAMYVAKLASCGATMKVVGASAITYTQDNSRYYPVRHENYNWDALHIRIPPEQDPNVSFDWRVQFGPYMPVQAFLDPLAGAISIDEASITPTPNRRIWSNFHIYTGLSRGDDTQDVMDQVGRRFEWTDSLTDPDNPREYRTGIIAADRNMYWTGNSPPWSTASHADSRNILRFFAYQNHTTEGTYSWWGRAGTSEHGPVDLNFAYDDGSVRRFDAVVQDDPRMGKMIDTWMPEYLTGRFVHNPKQ